MTSTVQHLVLISLAMQSLKFYSYVFVVNLICTFSYVVIGTPLLCKGSLSFLKFSQKGEVRDFPIKTEGLVK